MNTLDTHRPTYKNATIFFGNGLGDTLLALPAIRALARLFDGRATLLCNLSEGKMLVEALPLRDVIVVPMTRNVPDWTREFDSTKVASQLVDCDLFISLVPWYSKSLADLVSALSAKRKVKSIGFFEHFDTVLPLNFKKHAADLAFDVPKHFDRRLDIKNYSQPLSVSKRDADTVQKIVAALPGGARIVIVHADTGSNKMWPKDRFEQVLQTFLNKHKDFYAFVVGTVAQRFDIGPDSSRLIDCCGVPLGFSLGLIARAQLFLGVDSSMLHAADIFRVPSVGLFGDSNPVEFGFRFTAHSVTCHAPSMKDIQPARVLDGLEDMLSYDYRMVSGCD